MGIDPWNVRHKPLFPKEDQNHPGFRQKPNPPAGHVEETGIGKDGIAN